MLPSTYQIGIGVGSEMSNSVFNVIEPNFNDSLTLVISPDGSITPDRDTVKSLLSSRSTVDINVMTMKKVEANSVNITLDSLRYIHSEEAEDPEEMAEITRNVMNFRLDHDYTPHTSPSHTSSAMQLADDELEHTLSMLEGGLPPQIQPEPLTKITKIVKGKKQTIFVNEKQKAKMISTGQLKEKPSEPMFKKPNPVAIVKVKQKAAEVVEPIKIKDMKVEPEPIHKVPEQKPQEPLEEEDVEEDEDDDYMDDDEDDDFDDDDSDFEIGEEIKAKSSRIINLRKKATPVKEKVSTVKTRKPVKVKHTPEKIIEPEVKSQEAIPEKNVVILKTPDKKPIPKRERRISKPLPDDFALFSTPDIIRRVGKDHQSPEKSSPTTPVVTTPTSTPSTSLASPNLTGTTKPAKISPEGRSKSNSDKVKRISVDKSPDRSRRLSLDSHKKSATDNNPATQPLTKEKNDAQVSVQEFNDTLNNSSEPMPNDTLETLPSAEDIRAIIQSENTKSFTANLVVPELSNEDQTNMNPESPGLELDQSILDNINTDMISEDILYQVAQSLVGNTDLQNVIDKSIVDGNLMLDPSDETLAQALDAVSNVSLAQPVEHVKPIEKSSISKPGTQIVRADGRVVVIPPIERPTTRSRNKKVSPAVRQVKPAHKPLDEEHVSGNELDSSGDEEEESEDDPNKLWCVCNQPHNNRFMICCDTCEEWYHGKCVNVTKAMGHAMEEAGKEWICIYCKDKSLKRPNAAARRIRKASRTSTDSGGGGGSGKKTQTSTASSSSSSISASDDKKISQPGCVVCSKPCGNSSIYCSDNCILKHAQGVEKVVVFDRKSGKLLSGSNAPNAANLDKWLSENPSYEVVRSANKPKSKSLTQSKLKLVKNSDSDGVSLAIHKKGVNIGVLHHAPKETANQSPSKVKRNIGNITGLKIISKQPGPNQPQSKVRIVPAVPKPSQPAAGVAIAKQTKLVQPKLQVAATPKEKVLPMPQKTPKSRQAEVSVQPKLENLRDNVQKTFFEQLSTRLKNCADFKLTDNELKAISNEIESQLYKCFGDTGQKYKNKYRSLIFNIKDLKNETLWRRICEKAINPYQLVRLSPDDLASQELALWREREAKHQLDMIKKSELELLNCNRQYVFKTHKGEQIFEDDRPKDQVTELSGLGVDSTSNDNEEDDKPNKNSDKKNSKHKNEKIAERSRSKDRTKAKNDKDRKKDHISSSKEKNRRRSRSRDRVSKKESRRRSRSRDRHRRSSHKTSRHKRDEKSINTEKLDKKSKEILEQLVDKQIVPPLEDRLWKHVPHDDIITAPTVESDSDNEPSSTVTIPTPPRVTEPEEQAQNKLSISPTDSEPETIDTKSPEITEPLEPIWRGSISMVDVAQISITAHEVSGDCRGLGEEMPSSLDIVGRISPDTVWDYIGKMKSSNSKIISIIRLKAKNLEERMPYLALYSYLSSRNRLGVVKSVVKTVKDFYILPLAGHTPIPDPLLPLSGPGFEDTRPALLIGILVRDKRKRPTDAHISSHSHTKRIRVDIIIPVTTPSTPPSASRSYTPPPSRDPRIKLPVPLPVSPPEVAEDEPDEDMDEPYSPEDSDPDTVPEPTNSRLNADDISNLLTGSVKASSFLDSGLNSQTFEPFSNKFDAIPGLDNAPILPSNSVDLQRKMAELDQRIAAQKAEIHKVSQDLVSSASSDIGSSTLANIALPSNLQQILESIKTIGSKTDGVDSQGDNSNSSNSGTNCDLTIPLLLPKLSSRALKAAMSETTIPLNLPKPKQKSDSVLSSLSEEDLIKKAAEMLGETAPPRKAKIESHTPVKKARLGEPSIPGLESE